MMLKLDAPRVLVLAAFAAIFGLAAMPVEDPDFWFHLRGGQYIWETGSVPQTDPFSYTAPGNRWLTYAWLTELATYGLFAAFGYPGPILFFAALVALAYGLLYLTLRCIPLGTTAAAVLTAWAAAAGAHTWGARPQMVSLVLTAGLLYLMERHRRRGGRAVWAVPFLMLLWVNTHGGFLVGLGIVGCYLVGEVFSRRPPPRELLGVLGLSAAALLANPTGPGLLLAPLETLRSAAPQAFVQEWQSPNFHLSQLKFYELLLLAPLVVLPLSRRRPSATDLLLLLASAYLSLESARHIAYYSLVAPPVLGRHLASSPKSLALRVESFPWRALNGALLAVVFLSLGWRLSQSLPEEANLAAQRRHFPVGAAAFLRQHRLEGNMFNSYNWGGYLIWQLYPQYRVFIDGRAEVVYSDGVLRDYVQAYFAGPGWREVLERYSVRYIVVERGSPLAVLTAESRDWRLIYADEGAVIFQKNMPANTALLARLAG